MNILQKKLYLSFYPTENIYGYEVICGTKAKIKELLDRNFAHRGHKTSYMLKALCILRFSTLKYRKNIIIRGLLYSNKNYPKIYGSIDAKKALDAINQIYLDMQ